jgi:site-specific DNA recombinase
MRVAPPIRVDIGGVVRAVSTSMRAAIYARKSNEQSAVVDDQRSVARQVAHATAYALRKGWHVLDDHVYVDDGVSGAEFARRPGFLRLMNALEPRPAFDVLILSEESRLGREAIETAYALKRIVTAGVRVFFYLEDRERILQSPTDKLLMSVAAFADELERERARQRTFDALHRKAIAGHVTGGRVFGYDNVDVCDATGQRTHVERTINPLQADVVRRIFELSTGGLGLKAIAIRLNDDGAVAPRAQRGRPSAWCPSSVREVLQRDLYRGVVVWNKTRKRDTWGQKREHRRPKSEWLQVTAEHLRIVSDAVWADAQAACAARRSLAGTDRPAVSAGRPPYGRVSPYLLTGLVACGCCHGNLTVRTQRHGRQRVPRLACWNYTSRGRTVCDNKWEASLAHVDELVLETVEIELLHPEVIEVAIAHAVELNGAEYSSATSDRLRAVDDLYELDREAERLTELVAAGLGDLPAIVDRLRSIRERRAHLDRVTDRRGRLAHQPPRPMSVFADELRRRLESMRDLLRRNPAEARGVLQLLLAERITLTPQRDRSTRSPVFDVAITVVPDRLVAAELSLNGSSPTGVERSRTIHRRLAA